MIKVSIYKRLISKISRKEVFRPFGSIPIYQESRFSEEESRERLFPSLYSGTLYSHFLIVQLHHQMNHHLLMGLATSGVARPIKQINEQPQRELLVLLPSTFGQKSHSNGSQKSRRLKGRQRLEGKKRSPGRQPASLMKCWGFCKLRRVGWCVRIPHSPLGESTHIMGRTLSLYWTRVSWNFSWEYFLKNQEPAQVLFIILTFPTPLLSLETQGAKYK